jgi:N-acyl-phosphatidylethanolamine-hydrolysing phospholipase D
MRRRHFVSLAAAAAGAALLARRLTPAGSAATLLAGTNRAVPADLPAHHDPAGGFRNLWPGAVQSEGSFLDWQRERWSADLPPNPPPEAFPSDRSRIAYPHAPVDELRISWVGHATFLLQVGGLNLLTDPQWSRRASPVQFAGPTRFVPPGVPFEELPPIHAVLISHDHYDHLDSGTVRRLTRRFGEHTRWFTPLAYRRWMAARGATRVHEMDWWEEATLPTPGGDLRIVFLPAQHWTSRTPWDRQAKLWGSWAVVPRSGGAVYFGGDSGYFPEYPTIRSRLGSLSAAILPIGAYEPRWFMRPAHMNPEEAVRSFLDLGGEGTMIGMHWGTWRLTDEDPLEPPVRTKAEWERQGLAPERLWIPRHGETRVL